MKKIFLSCLALGLMFNTAIAQSDDDLVENGSFEDTEGKIKKGGLIDLAIGWISPTKTSADLYSENVKEKYGIPNNVNGKEDAQEGSYYAGFTSFSYGDKEPRSYVSTKLRLPMRKGQKYCVKFYVSLAESSKYGSNNIGINFSKKQYNIDEDKSIVGESHVMHINNPVFNAMFGWEEICGTYTSTGAEKFLTIGNFSSNGNTESERIKKPASFRGQQGIRAYYYVDNISVVLIDDESDCKCQTDSQEKTSLVYAVSPVNPEGMTVEQIAKYSVVYFGFNSDELSLNAEEHLKNILAILKANPESKLKLINHMDSDEVIDEKAKTVDTRRTEAIKKYFADNSVSGSRISVENKRDTTPAAKGDSEIVKAKNRRIEFVLIK